MPASSDRRRFLGIFTLLIIIVFFSVSLVPFARSDCPPNCPKPACLNNSACDDRDPHTKDICVNPGELVAYCDHINLACLDDMDCPAERPSGNRACANDDLYATFLSYRCRNPGTTSSFCEETESQMRLIQDCGEDTVPAWESYCRNDTSVWMRRNVTERGCENRACFQRPAATDVFVKDCGQKEACSSGQCVSTVLCTSGPCCDTETGRFRSLGSQPAGFSDDFNGYCLGTASPFSSDEIHTVDHYCSGQDSQAHQNITLVATCGKCQYCVDNQLACAFYPFGTDCGGGRCDSGGLCVSCADECPRQGAWCEGNVSVACGNCDDDPCLEATRTSCTYGCSDGLCMEQPRPDITITKALVQSPVRPRAGENVTVAFVLKNIGEAPADSVFWKLETGSGEGDQENSIPIRLGINRSAYIFTKIIYRNSGCYTAKVITDPRNLVQESNEANNEKPVHIAVGSGCGSWKGEGVLGDVNCDLGLDISDAVSLLNHLFADGRIPCPDSADFNWDGNIDIGDAIGILDYLF